MCLAANVPLIESGTTGFNGQVQVIVRGKTACYDCNEKMAPKTFPVCTIRNTPSQPIHCIVWAKSYLLPELFGESEDAPELDTSEDADNAEEIENLRHEALALKKIRDSMGSDEFAQKVFDKVFKEDIERLQKMEDMWKMRRPPEAISYEQASSESIHVDSSISQQDQRAWTNPETCRVFLDSLQRLSKRLQDDKAEALKSNLSTPTISFDKDDPDTLDFVASAANIRSHIFGIEAKSKFDVKQMAGNIIPAIATTNAMIAGLCVIQALKVLKGDFGKMKMVFLNKANMRSGDVDKPNPDCAVCGVAMTRVKIDSEQATLRNLVEDILKGQLGYNTDEITVMNEQGIVYDPDMEDNLDKKLVEDLGISDAKFVTVKDDEEVDGQDPRLDLQIAIEVDETPDKDGPTVQIVGDKPDLPRQARKKYAPQAASDGQHLNGDATTTNGDVSMLDRGDAAPTTTTTTTSTGPGKRKRDVEEADLDHPDANGAVKKMAKISTASSLPVDEQGTILLDEVEEGPIEID